MKNPLTFVCTSLKEYPECFDQQLISDAHIQEISVIFKWVEKCVKNWPVFEWGPVNLRLIGVIMPSRQLVSYVCNQ